MRELHERTLRALRGDRGSVTAEFALTVPAVILVLGLMIGGIQLSAERVSLVSLAGEIARLEARGDAALAANRIAALPKAPTISRANDGKVLCVTVASAGRGVLSAIHISATGCAAISEALGDGY